VDAGVWFSARSGGGKVAESGVVLSLGWRRWRARVGQQQLLTAHRQHYPGRAVCIKCASLFPLSHCLSLSRFLFDAILQRWPVRSQNDWSGW
jgi:hypothetical protein